MENVDVIKLAKAFPGAIIAIQAGDLVAANARLIDEAKANMERAAAQKAGAHRVTAEEVMETLRISETTLWRWQKSGYLVPLNVGGQRRYKSADVEAIMEGKA